MKDGFYLKKFEIFNWGTFDNEVETFYLDDKITVVSGDNGSGKSTVVDALVSLLVPNKLRKYNLSATDGSAKKSRSEVSYVRWAYKNQETQDGIKTAFLRGNDTSFFTYSVLLGYFFDESTEKELTLASFFRTNTTDGVEKFSVISQNELSIQADFLSILGDANIASPVLKLKNTLKTRSNTKIYDKFEEYRQDYSRFFWLKSNAIELFNKVVSLKEIKDLNSFFKENMLEHNEDILKEFRECEKNYLGVKDIYDSIVLAEKKLEILSPFMEQKKEFAVRTSERESIQFLEENFGNYTAGIESGILEKTIEKDQENLENTTLEKEYAKNTFVLLGEEKRQIENLIESSDFARRLRELENTLAMQERDYAVREKNCAEYREWMRNLWGSFDGTALHFEKNTAYITEKIQDTILQKEHTEVRKREQFLFQNTVRETVQNFQTEIVYFRSRQNLLPERLANIRKMICKHLGTDEEHFPFVCELVRVKDSEKPWTMAIEKLLQNFATEMLVPDEWIDRVNTFVDSNHLKGKLKYNRVHLDQSVNISEVSDQSVVSKIDIRHGSPFENWIRQGFADRFDHRCLETANDPKYHDFPKVLTISGLIKNRQSFLKDDRAFSSRDYILGWDNTAKILELESEKKTEEKKLERINSQIANLQITMMECENMQRIFVKLESVKVFGDVDVYSLERQIAEVKKEKEKIEKDPAITGYKVQLDAVKQKMTTEEQSMEKLTKAIGIIEDGIRKRTIRRNQLIQILEKVDGEAIFTRFQSSPYQLTTTDLQDFETEKEDKIGQIRRKKDKIVEILNAIEKKMNGLASAYRENRMTISEKNEISSGISEGDFREYLDREYHKIQDEELYKYKQQFEKEFRDNLFSRLNDFYYALENEQTEIETKIAEINATLKTISYSKETYIEIAHKDNNKKADGIEDFKRDFREKVINKRELDMNDKIRAFENIKNLMEKLIAKEQESWVANVIDVRNWFLFSVKERYKEDDLVKDIFESSSGKSGGQTIKLAYGVLAAALLYQYGIREKDTNLLSSAFSKSFRLVVIDEVFAKLDIDNSRYVLDLFDKLGLQLFIITPTNTINVLEDYVKTLYFISNNTGEKSFKNKIDIVSRKVLEGEK